MADCVALYVFEGANTIIAKAHNDEQHFMGFDLTTGALKYIKFYDYIDGGGGGDGAGPGMMGPSGPFGMWESVENRFHAYDPATGNEVWVTDPIDYSAWSTGGSNQDRHSLRYLLLGKLRRAGIWI